MTDKLPAVVYFIMYFMGRSNDVTPIHVEYGYAAGSEDVVYELSRNAAGNVWGTTFLKVNANGTPHRVDARINKAFPNEFAAREYITAIGRNHGTNLDK